MNNDLLVARCGNRLVGVTEAGTLSTKQLRDFDDYEIAKFAIQFIREADYLVFGDDYRWLHASTPKRVMRRRWQRYIKAIESELP